MKTYVFLINLQRYTHGTINHFSLHNKHQQKQRKPYKSNKFYYKTLTQNIRLESQESPEYGAAQESQQAGSTVHIPKVNKDYVNAIPRTHVTRSIFKLSNTPTYFTRSTRSDPFALLCNTTSKHHVSSESPVPLKRYRLCYR